jgi:thioredoxin reductase (NADPH)
MTENDDAHSPDHEVVVVGAGAAGLAAAALLARCKRKVIVIGQGDRANSAAEEVHNVPFAEGLPPQDFYASMGERLARLDVPVLDGHVDSVELDDEHGRVRVVTTCGTITAARLLLATGLDYDLPTWVPTGTWGRSIFSCPFCHASEHDGEAFAVIGTGSHAVDTALLCAPHASTLIVLVSDPAATQGPTAQRVRELGGDVVADVVAGADVVDTGEVVLATEGGNRVRAGAVLLLGLMRARSALTDMVGLTGSATGFPEVDPEGRTQHPLVWLAGNAAKPYYMLVESMGSGIRAAVSLHRDLALASLPNS